MYYDRRANPKLLEALDEGGSLHELVTWVREDPILDLQLRGDPKTKRSVATVYVGLTKILDVTMFPGGTIKLSAHSTHKAAGFVPAWGNPRPAAEVGADWPAVAAYLRKALAAVSPHLLAGEGTVQALLARNIKDGFSVVDAQAVVGFDSQPEKNAIFKTSQEAYGESIGHWIREPWYRKPSFGPELDLLAVDATGRVLVVEIKHVSDAARIALAPAQVGFYAAVFRRWANAYGPKATETIRGMVEQRVRLGLSTPPPEGIREPLHFVPVIAIGGVAAGADALTPRSRQRLSQVREALRRSGLHEPELRLWILSQDGVLSQIPTPAPDSTGLTLPTVELGSMSGDEIMSRVRAGTMEFNWVGRMGGLKGKRFRDDLRTGAWRTFMHRVSHERPGGANWFTLEDFTKATDASEHDGVADGQVRPEDLARELGIESSALRSWLRRDFARPAAERNEPWTMTDAQVRAARTRFARRPVRATSPLQR